MIYKKEVFIFLYDIYFQEGFYGKHINRISDITGNMGSIIRFLFLYAIKTNEKLIEKQEKRETNYQNLISVLTEKYDILNDLKDEINHIKNILEKDRDA